MARWTYCSLLGVRGTTHSGRNRDPDTEATYVIDDVFDISSPAARGELVEEDGPTRSTSFNRPGCTDIGPVPVERARSPADLKRTTTTASFYRPRR